MTPIAEELLSSLRRGIVGRSNRFGRVLVRAFRRTRRLQDDIRGLPVEGYPFTGAVWKFKRKTRADGIARDPLL